MLTVKRVKHTPMYDVFIGMGWKTHSRILFTNGQYKIVRGVKLNKQQMNEFTKTIGVA